MIRRPPRSTLFPLHDALPISTVPPVLPPRMSSAVALRQSCVFVLRRLDPTRQPCTERSEEHTSELQSQSNLVCRLLLEKKKPEPSAASCLPTLAHTHRALSAS